MKLKPLIHAVWQILIMLIVVFPCLAQPGIAQVTDSDLRRVLRKHKALVSIPNLPADTADMMRNLDWVASAFEELGFTSARLASDSYPILLVEREFDPALKTVLIYFHIDGQPVDAAAWEQDDPFTPVLKQRDSAGLWRKISYDRIEGPIDDEWRVFARSAADDKAPILMLHGALSLLQTEGQRPAFNLKILFDPQEEYGSTALLTTLEQYKARYAADYFIVMDGPAHESNRPTLTFGCRGIATCALTTYGAPKPQHSGHMGNYVPNPVFALSRLLASMKDETGRVLIEDYYADVDLDEATVNLLDKVPFEESAFNQRLNIHQPEQVGRNYQEALQYPTLNVRQLSTSWSGPGLKTIIPAYARADLDLRLVPETPGEVQVQRLKQHLARQGYLVLEGPPTASQRLAHPNIVSFEQSRILNAFRTDPNDDFGRRLRGELTQGLGEEPLVVRMMGGTVPIIPLIEALNVPTVILPMVNLDNNQHAPNENIRIGNIRQGIAICLSLLQANFN